MIKLYINLKTLQQHYNHEEEEEEDYIQFIGYETILIATALKKRNILKKFILLFFIFILIYFL